MTRALARSAFRSRFPLAPVAVLLLVSALVVGGPAPAGALDADRAQAAPPGVDPAAAGTPPTSTRLDGLPWVGAGGPVPGIEATGASPEGTTDLTFADPAIGGEVYDVFVEADGQILVGGRIDSVAGQARGLLHRLQPDGSLDTSFDPRVTGFSVNDVTEDATGRIFIGGHFGEVGGVGRSGVARLLPDGRLDTTFVGPSISGQVEAIAVQPDGRVLVAGNFGYAGQVLHRGVVRLNANGSIDTSFVDPGVMDYGNAQGAVYAIALNADGTVLIGGHFRFVGGQSHSLMARLHADGTVDPIYGPQVSGTTVVTMAAATDGSVFIAGSITAVGGQPVAGLARLDNGGTFDPSFDAGIPAAYEPVQDLALQPDGRLLVGGSFTEVAGVPRAGLARLEPGGALDPTLADPFLDGEVLGIAVRPDGGILVGGSILHAEGYSYRGLAPILATSTSRSGVLDQTFGLRGVWNLTDFPSIANDVAVQPDGSVVTAGSADGFGGRILVTRTNSLGVRDRSFNRRGVLRLDLTPGNDWAEAVLVQPNGKIVVAGHIANAAESMVVIRLRADGTKDPTFSGDGVATVDLGPGLDVAIDLARLPDGDLVVAGLATDSSRHIGMARLNGDGTLDRSFSGDGKVVTDLGGAAELAYGVAAQPDGRIVVAGVKSPTRAVVLRYRSDGRLDPSFSSDGVKPLAFTGNASAATAIAVADDGDLVVAATDGTGGGRFAAARLDQAGRFDRGFAGDGMVVVDAGPGYDEAWDLALRPDGRILLGGDTQSEGAFALVQVLADGTPDATFSDDGIAAYDLRVGAEMAVGLALQPDGHPVLAGFEFASTPHVLVARAWP